MYVRNKRILIGSVYFSDVVFGILVNTLMRTHTFLLVGCAFDQSIFYCNNQPQEHRNRYSLFELTKRTETITNIYNDNVEPQLELSKCMHWINYTLTIFNFGHQVMRYVYLITVHSTQTYKVSLSVFLCTLKYMVHL